MSEKISFRSFLYDPNRGCGKFLFGKRRPNGLERKDALQKNAENPVNSAETKGDTF